MSEGLAALLKDYESKKADLLHTDVELEGGQDPLRIFFRKFRTTSQQNEIERQADPKTGVAGPDCIAEIVLQCALNEDGSRMFPNTTRAELRNKVDYTVLVRIVAGIGGVRELTDPKAS